jgi:Na+/H+ antiporter NhaD/arsenite permease-like protein
MNVELGSQLSLWTLAPFVLMLLSIAILPLACEKWFHPNRNKAIVAAVLGIPTVIYLLVAFGDLGLHVGAETAEEYISFIVLLFALFTISGGIYISGNLVATPWVNLGILGLGSIIASFIGTMGASMLLIRPLLRANSERTRIRHTVIFFIFAVSNLGGLLTPLGDPPLFLGFLRGVPFQWTFNLWKEWLLSVGLVLIVYLVIEFLQYRREPAQAKAQDQADYEPVRAQGTINLLFFALVITTIVVSGPLGRIGEAIHFPFVREVILVILAIASLTIGPKKPRKDNDFAWGPIVEVGVLFAGIFATMIPALAILQAKGASIGLSHPWQYFWATGGLSSFLDNAPTYLAFTATAQGQLGVETVGALTASGVVPGIGFSPAQFLMAISCGAVMLGAMTYIGNAPNLAVKCIADHAGVRMPSFFGYMKYSIIVLIPIFLIVTAVFFI